MSRLQDADGGRVYTSEPSVNATSPNASSLHEKDRGISIAVREDVARQPSPYRGYRFGLRVAFGSAVVVFFVNLILTVIGLAHHGRSQGLVTLQTGKCSVVKTTNEWLHLLINVLSTALLGASNYYMQCLSAPTRADVDKAHQSKRWLDIGIQSVRNLGKISWARRYLWLVLGLSSLPLHLLYNSAIFATLGFTSYTDVNIFVVSPGFLTGSPWQLNYTSYYYDHQSIDHQATRLQEAARSDNGSFERLEPHECASTYQKSFIFDYGDLLVVTSDPPLSNNSVFDFRAGLSYGEITFARTPDSDCNSSRMLVPACNITLDKSGSSDWVWEGNNTISYCMAEKVESRCELQLSLVIMIIVLVCNIIKGASMAIVMWRTKEEPLVTFGDAVASFLQRPDSTTASMCLAGKQQFLGQSNWRNGGIATQYVPRRRFWFVSASFKRWIIVYGLCSVAILGTTALLVHGLRSGSASGTEVMHVGFGEISAITLIDFWDHYNNSVVAMVLLANTPQLVLSLLYFGYNGLFTCMLLAEEWAGYGHERKALRVSSPRGSQRSTYRLQLPYRFGIPLMMVAVLLHWLVSQSIFLARLQAYSGSSTRTPRTDFTTCGYSARGILATIIVSSFVFFIGLVFGFRRFAKGGMPVVGSCSAAISAACHPPPEGDGQEEEEETWTKAVKWGAVRQGSLLAGENDTREYGEERIGHCCFSSREVDPPVPGELYAGQNRLERRYHASASTGRRKENSM